MAIDPTLTEALAADLPKSVELYRYFHANPELSMQETKTADKIASLLDEYGIENFRSGGTGVVGILRNGEGPTIAYRADTDGLPIEEDTGLPYASRAKGTLPDGTETFVMHGCGHDSHFTSALEVAKLLSEHTSLWSGTVVFLFQPGEETAAGSRAMLDDGLWDKAPRPEVVYGQHIGPTKAGTIGLVPGTAMAMADSIKVTVHGRQAHGSQPQMSIDPIVLGASMVTRLQTIVSREIAPDAMAVVTVGTFHAGLKENIIPAEATFALNIRTFEQSVRDKVLEAVERLIKAEAAGAGAPEPTFEKLYEFPRCFNDPELAEDLISRFRAELGEDNVEIMDPMTGSEDFGAFGDDIDVPYVYWFFGGYSDEKLEGEHVFGNHSPHFGPDQIDVSLDTAVRTALTALLKHLGK